MRLFCIDPGTEKSGMVIYDTIEHTIYNPVPNMPNDELLGFLSYTTHSDRLVIEMVSSYGMPVGREVFETVYWIGLFSHAFGLAKTTRIYRKDVKLTLCQSPRAKDANIRRAVLDAFPATGGGKTPQIGTKACPGPLWGCTGHAIQALALGLTYKEMEKGNIQAGLT